MKLFTSCYNLLQRIWNEAKMKEMGHHLWGNWKTLDLHSHMHRNDLTWQPLNNLSNIGHIEEKQVFWNFSKFLKISGFAILYFLSKKGYCNAATSAYQNVKSGQNWCPFTLPCCGNYLHNILNSHINSLVIIISLMHWIHML